MKKTQKTVLEVYEPGDTLQFKRSLRTVWCTVLSVRIYRGDRVLYEVSYWNGEQRVEALVEAFELLAQEDQEPPRMIGFINADTE
jgi:hypothetical protein